MPDDDRNFEILKKSYIPSVPERDDALPEAPPTTSQIPPPPPAKDD